MDDVQTAVLDWSDRMFDGKLPDGQPSGTAFAIALTFTLKPPSLYPCVLCGAPKAPGTKLLLRDHNITLSAKEWMIDFVVMEMQSTTKRVPLIACESEMHDNEGVGYSFELDWDGKRGYPRDGYIWDYCKLLHFPAHRLLFIARLPRRFFDRLEWSLRQCAQEYHAFWKDRQLNIVLLPNDEKMRAGVRIGKGMSNSDVSFENIASM